MSERLLGAIVGMHGDDSGLIMPPSIAPIQVVIIPIVKKEGGEPIMAAAEELAASLRSSGMRVKIDDRDLRPGNKYYDWEIKGVPLRLEIGARDLENNNTFSAKRTGGKEPISLVDPVANVERLLEEVASELRNRSAIHSENVIQPLPSFEENEGIWTMNGTIDDGLIYELAFDGTDAHAEVIERTTGLTFLGDATEPYDAERKCLLSGVMTTRRVILAKTY